MIVPQGGGRLDGTESLFIWWRLVLWMRLQWIRTTFTSAFEECLLRHLFLQRKMSRVKFKKIIVIFNKTMSRNKAFV